MSRAVRIGNASGFFGDRASAMREIVLDGAIDVVTGDYLSEVTMTILAKLRAKAPPGSSAGYVPTFLHHLQPVLGVVLERKIKVVVNAGGLNPGGLAKELVGLAAKAGLAPKVAWIEGDDLAPRMAELRASGVTFASLETGEALGDDPALVVTANAYLGAWGITRALAEGADIVICPRVTDASLVVGAAAHWHGWSRTDYDALAGAVAAGHVIECGPQATGGNFSGFQRIADMAKPGFPIAEIAEDGSSVITKHAGTGGAVTIGTVTAQLVYEIGDPHYPNPDVVTHLETLRLAEDGADRVRMSGIKGSPPPSTTKVAITTRGEHRNELTLAFVGLDIDAKIALVERTTRALFAKKPLALAFQRIGSGGAATGEAKTQDEATTLLRIVATSTDEAAVSRSFSSALIELGLSSYPGLFLTDLPGPASEAMGYVPSTIEQGKLEVAVVLPDGRREVVPPPAETAPLSASTKQDPSARSRAVNVETTRAPLGRIADARSGDKGSHANVGVWVYDDDAFAWLDGELTIARFKELVPEAKDLEVLRHPLPNLRALNFVVNDLLHGGAVASPRFDRQAKALGEFLRSRELEIPTSLLRER